MLDPVFSSEAFDRETDLNSPLQIVFSYNEKKKIDNSWKNPIVYMEFSNRILVFMWEFTS